MAQTDRYEPMKDMKTKVLILGAGLAGLSAAYHLKDEDYRIFEKEHEVGGLCRSYQVKGFTFDYTGHLLHFKKPEMRKWVEEILEDNIVYHDRKAFIYSNQVFTDYPFQANLYGLPKEVIKECLTGFIEAYYQDQKKAGTSIVPYRNFEEWIVKTLGEGIANHFMIPFNEKLWKRSLKEMTAEWTSWLVPRPKLEDVINGALGIVNKPMGYNPSFLYPRQGGIQSLANRLSRHIHNIHLNEEVVEIDIKKKEVAFSSGKKVGYEHLISTLPLNVSVSRCKGLPAQTKEKIKKLEYISVQVINLGVEKKNLSDKHWIYFPENRFPFYRVGFPSNLSPFMAPEGTTSLSIEVSSLPDRGMNKKELLHQVKEGLFDSGFLSSSAPIVVEDVRMIPHAYVIFNHDYSRIVPNLRSALRKHGIYTIGRYGSWEHTSMEDALSQGKEIAQHLCKK
jgi:protoporphyrinogen oxidase